MFGSEILDVSIGLVFVFLIFSLVCSSIKEAIETASKYRAHDLEKGLREILRESDNKGLVEKFYQHSLVYALFQGDYRPQNARNLPSYIPARTFALTIMDLIHNFSDTAAVVPQPGSQGGLFGADRPRPIDQFNAALDNATAQYPKLKEAIFPLVRAAEGDMSRLRTNIENWYDSSMDRVSGWYKRRTQIIIASVGLSMAVLLNVDAISITRYLNGNRTARSVLINQLQSGSAKPNASAADQRSNTDQIHYAMNWLQTEGDFPIGWRAWPTNGLEWLLKISGILLTTFAASLGAPFWFDLLNRFMVVRSTVKPEEKSRPEASKD